MELSGIGIDKMELTPCLVQDPVSYTFKVLNGTAPGYLSDLIERYIPVRILRSESYSLLRVPRGHTGMYRERFF